MSRRAVVLAPVLALASLGLTIACDDGRSGTGQIAGADSPVSGEAGPSTAGTPGLLRLWRDLTPVEHASRAPGAEAGQPWWPDQASPWLRVVEHDDGSFGYAPLTAPGSGLPPGGLRLSAADGRGLATGGPVRGGQAFGVSLTVRSEGAGDMPLSWPVLVVVERAEPFDPAETLDPDQVLAMLDPRKQASHVLTAELAVAPVTLRAEFLTDPSTRALAVYLLAPDAEWGHALRVEAFSLERFREADAVARGGEVRRMQRLPDATLPEAVRVPLDREERQALLAVPPARFVWELPPGDDARRMECALGVMPRDGALPGAVRFVLEADGERLFERERRGPASLEEPAWLDVAVALPAGARRIVWRTEPVGDDPPLAFLGHPAVTSNAPDPRPNVVLISLDTLRPDRLGCYGARPSHTPRLDALAAEGLRYARAYSTSSYTLPSHGSMLTGQYPAFHGAVDVTDALDPQHSPLLADLLARAGYLTAGFTGGGYVSTQYGFGTGFDRYSHNDPVWAVDGVRGRQLMQTMSWERTPIRPELLRRYDAGAIERWIGEHADGPPFFLFLHTYIAHNYAPDAKWLGRLGLLGREGEPDFERPFNHKERVRFNEGEQALHDAVYEQYMPYYDATVGMADDFVGRVIDALAAAGLDDDTLLVVTSDHGEEFGEHGFYGHGESLYEAVTHIPFVARLPAAQAGQPGRVVDEPLSLVDVAPWILSVVGMEPDPRMAVRPPLGPERLSPPGRSTLVMELDNHRYRMSAVRVGDLKLLVDLGRDGQDYEQPRETLFDVVADPDERDDRLASDTKDAARLRTILERFHALAELVRPRSGGALDLDLLDPEMRKTLEALGYLQGVREPPGR